MKWIVTLIANWRIWLPVLALGGLITWHNAAVSRAETRGRDAALADVASVAAKKGALADAAANTVQACYAAGRIWNREAGACAK
jgi:hypothetical protein